MNKSAAERNMEATLEVIRADTLSATAELSDLHHQIAEATTELEATKARAVSLHLEIDALALDHRQRQVGIQEYEERKKRELTVLKDQIRDAMQELRRVNSWIVTANDEHEEKKADLRRIHKEIAEKQPLTEGILALQNEYAAEERKRDLLRLENTLAIENSLAEVQRHEAEAHAAEERRDEAEARAIEAVNAKHEAIKEEARIMGDLRIYIGRVREKYQEAFPELDMVL